MAKGTVNKVVLLGRLGQNPEVRQTQTGMTVATLNLATNEVVKQETQTEWHRVIVFGKAAEAIQQYSKKGDQLFIEGRIRTSKWQDKEGNNRYSTEIICNQFQFIGGGSQGSQNSNHPTPDYGDTPEANNNFGTEKPNTAKMPSFDEITSDFNDDIPF
jgi:single-strand DNA-binding protein